MSCYPKSCPADSTVITLIFHKDTLNTCENMDGSIVLLKHVHLHINCKDRVCSSPPVSYLVEISCVGISLPYQFSFVCCLHLIPSSLYSFWIWLWQDSKSSFSIFNSGLFSDSLSSLTMVSSNFRFFHLASPLNLLSHYR